MRIILERRRAEEEHVAAEAGNGRDRPPAWFTGMSRRTTQALRFVNDEQIDARANRLVGQLRAVDEHLEGNHGAAVHVERIEVRAEIPRHVGKAAARRAA